MNVGILSEQALAQLRGALSGIVLERPTALYLLAVPVIVLLYALATARGRNRIYPALMRAIVLALFVLALAGPRQVLESSGRSRPVLVDGSASITPAMREWSSVLLGEKLGLRPADPAYIFGANVQEGTVESVLRELRSPEGCAGCRPEATDLEQGLELLAAQTTSRGGPAVVVTDGWENRGRAARAIAPLVAARIPIEIFTPAGSGMAPNIAMTQLALPAALSRAEPFALGVTLNNFNSQPAAGELSVYRGGKLLEKRKVTLDPGAHRFDFPIRVEPVGLTSYRAVFTPQDARQDRYTEDDSLVGWSAVAKRRKALLLTDSTGDAEYLKAVLRATGLEPTVVELKSGRFRSPLGGYDAVVLNDVPRDRLSPATQKALVAYVARGGSVAMVGGDSSFGLGGYRGSSIERMMPVTMKPPQHKEPKRALILVIDKSGSMGRGDKLTYAKAATVRVTETLKDSDLIGVIGFDSQPFVVLPLAPLSQSRPYLGKMVSRLTARGRTYLMPALKEAERILARSDASVRHVVILTDGETGGTLAMYYSLVSRMRHEGGTTISTIAIGRQANIDLLQAISRYGGGAFYQTDSPKNLPELFLADVRQHAGGLTMVERDFIPHTVSPDPILESIAGRRLPEIKGYVSTVLKPGARLSMFVDRGGRREPIVASWKYGSGRALAVTTDAGRRWASPWIKEKVFQGLWRRLFGWMVPRTRRQDRLEAALGYRDGRVTVRLIDYGPKPVTGRLLTAVVTRPDGTRAEATISEGAPGEFRGTIEAPEPGTYYVDLKPVAGKGPSFPPLAYTVSRAVKAELPRPAPNYALLERIASGTGGRLNPTPEEVELERPTRTRRLSLDPYLVVLAMLLLIGEAALRRALA